MNEWQIERLLGALERIATALEPPTPRQVEDEQFDASSRALRAVVESNWRLATDGNLWQTGASKANAIGGPKTDRGVR